MNVCLCVWVCDCVWLYDIMIIYKLTSTGAAGALNEHMHTQVSPYEALRLRPELSSSASASHTCARLLVVPGTELVLVAGETLLVSVRVGLQCICHGLSISCLQQQAPRVA